jgi:hypothetical protein
MQEGAGLPAPFAFLLVVATRNLHFFKVAKIIIRLIRPGNAAPEA